MSTSTMNFFGSFTTDIIKMLPHTSVFAMAAGWCFKVNELGLET